MMRLFKPGDRVELRSGGPLMVVKEYLMGENMKGDGFERSDAVLCAWFDPKLGKQESVYSQWDLIKCSREEHWRRLKEESRRTSSPN